MQLYEYTTLLKKSYEQAARYSLIAIILLVLIHFRNLLSVVLALMPVGVGFLWLGGFMGWFGVPLNPANIMTLAAGDRHRRDQRHSYPEPFRRGTNPELLARSTGKAVLVSGLTTHRRVWQPDPGEASGDSKFGFRDGASG